MNAGADVNRTDGYGYSSLMCAASNGHEECVDLLLKAGADVNTEDAYNYTAVIYASKKGNDKCVKFLVKAGADVNTGDIYNKTALFYAVSKGHYEALDVLVSAGADVNQSSSECIIPPISIASRVGFDEAVELLIQSGADVNKIGQHQCSPLMEAVANGHVKCMKLLLEAGADVNFIHRSGVTLLMCAGVPLYILFEPREIYKYLNNWKAERNFLSCVKLLLQSGAKINIRKASSNALKLQMALHNVSSDRSDICLLLYAAGETLDGTTDAEKLPDSLKFEALQFNLKHLCREVIRKHLLNLDSHTNLFKRIPQLGLPSVLTVFLFYGVTLQYEAAQ